MRKKIFVASVSIALVLIMLLTSFALPAVNASPTTASENAKITTETGITTDLGGGNHFYVKFGSDAAFGILWGTQQDPNNIYFVSYISRNLGYLNVDEPNGTVLAQKPLKIFTLNAVKLDHLIEYNDSNGNGILSYNPQMGNTIGDILGMGREQIYKGVDLNTAWTASNWQNGTDGNGNLTWSFTLTATNLTYSVPLRYSADNRGDGVLNSIALTFHLTASTDFVSNISVPQYNVSMTREPMGDKFNDLQNDGDLTFSGNVTSYHVKWDKNIAGWDADPRDKNANLMAEYGILVENYIPPAVTGLMALSECQRMVAATGDNGTMTADANQLDGASSLSNAFSLRTPRLTFGGEQTKIGTFEWVQNVTVDGRTENATSQVTAVMPFNERFRGNDFYGFAAMVGISYPNGKNIVQDPDISSQAVTDLALASSGPADNGNAGTSSTPRSLPMGLILIASIAIIAVVLATVIIRRRRPKQPQQNYEMPNQPQGDWGKYYEKK
jgi:hypothetical protein